ncbi:centromere protein C isoform X1 [Malus sylvestris]|uniref:centromere protein C isoform X1 n=1 Tax=Malus sylvestris TaxID=3752 RepID=UPI0021AD21C3|nr:centromere protein C isoform X1 [Malus sylvestris]
MNDAWNSDPVDPLQGFTGLALFHQSCKAIPDSSTSIPFDFDRDLQAIHSQFNSTASQVKLVDQVKNILSDTSKTLKSGNPQATKQKSEGVPEKASQPNMSLLLPFDINGLENARNGKENFRGGAALVADQQAIHIRLKPMASQHSPSKPKDQVENIVSGTSEILEPGNRQALKQKNKVVPGKAAESPRQRRPALGLKRARFSMMPDSSQHDTSLLPPFDAQKYTDPEELFKELEKYENAKKELEKLKGGAILDAYKHNPSPIKRTRRPSILRKRAKHKHSYPLMDFESGENGSPLNHSTRIKPNENVAWEEMDLAGSLAEEVNVGDFDELLSLSTECLEGDGAVTHVQKCLRMKPIEPEKSDVPELQGIPKGDCLTDIDNLLKGLISSTGVKHRKRAEGSIHFASPKPPKSPFTSILDLHKRILHSSPSSDPFSAHGIDQLPVPNPSSVENRNKQSELVDMREQITVSNALKSPFIEQDSIEVAVIGGSSDVDLNEFSYASKRSVSEDSSKHDARIDFGSSGSHVGLEDNIGGSNMHKRVINDTSHSPGANTDAWDNGDKGDNDGDEIQVENEHEEAVASAEPVLNVADSTLGKAGNTLNDNMHPDADTDNRDNVANDGDETQVEDKHEEAVAGEEPELNVADSTMENTSSALNENIQIKENSRPRIKRKSREVSRRKSLAGAGTTWQSGVRRSTRIKTRPLEYWKGERLLYGRIHDSLVTVIGIKYASPEKDNGRGPLKVKSFVSDEYKELVELAALH